VRVAVVAVGDELLLGDVVNTNLAWLGETLAAAGLPVVLGVEVGDDVDPIVAAVRTAFEAADAVVVSGGLGPTSDDRTLLALQQLAPRWTELPNPVGTAPGVRTDVAGRPLFAVPGVPGELRRMVTDHVVPWLRDRAGAPPALVTRQLRVAVLGEPEVAARLAPLEADLPDGVRLAYLAGTAEIRVRLSGTDPATVRAAWDRAAALLGDVVAAADDESLAARVLGLLAARSTDLAVAESLTGGLLAATLVDVPGASTVFRGGVVAYATPAKHALLGVDPELLARVGPVDAEVARQMALGARSAFGAGVGVATTGVAGPDPQDGVAPGTVHVAVVGPGLHSAVGSLSLAGGRSQIRAQTVAHALDLLRRALG
jgi:nicotinamide-nucleotide amidase